MLPVCSLAAIMAINSGEKHAGCMARAVERTCPPASGARGRAAHSGPVLPAAEACWWRQRSSSVSSASVRDSPARSSASSSWTNRDRSKRLPRKRSRREVRERGARFTGPRGADVDNLHAGLTGAARPPVARRVDWQPADRTAAIGHVRSNQAIRISAQCRAPRRDKRLEKTADSVADPRRGRCVPARTVRHDVVITTVCPREGVAVRLAQGSSGTAFFR